MARVTVKIKFLLSRGKALRIQEEEARLIEEAPVGKLLEAIQKAFADIPEVQESKELLLFVQADPRSSLSDYYIDEGSTVIIVPAMEDIENLVERVRSGR